MTSPYRAGRLPCPECGTELTHYEGRDKWRCLSCTGTLVGASELELDPADLTAAAAVTPRACPICKAEMHAFELHGLTLDRCAHDDVIWFDRGELGKLRTALAEAPADWAERWAQLVRFGL